MITSVNPSDSAVAVSVNDVRRTIARRLSNSTWQIPYAPYSPLTHELPWAAILSSLGQTTCHVGLKVHGRHNMDHNVTC